jgi:hypothetical protein
MRPREVFDEQEIIVCKSLVIFVRNYIVTRYQGHALRWGFVRDPHLSGCMNKSAWWLLFYGLLGQLAKSGLRRLAADYPAANAVAQLKS